MGTPLTTVTAVTGLNPTSGDAFGGTTVTITGVGFTGATAVTFGDTPASSFTVNSDTEIVATAPEISDWDVVNYYGDQTVDVTVTALGGTSAASPGSQYTYFITVAIMGPESAPPNTPYRCGVLVFNAKEVPGTQVDLTVTLSGAAATFTEGVIEGDTVDTCTPSGTQITSHIDSDNVTQSYGETIAVDLTVLPTASGTVTAHAVTTSTNYKCAGSFSFTTTIAPAKPAVSAVSPASGPVTGGTVLIITGSGFTDATAVTFGSTPASSFTVNSDTSITATAPPAAGIGAVDVTVTTAGGTSATSAADQFTYTYAFAGFAPPVASPPAVNRANAGSTVPVKFGLGGDQGMDIFATGSPAVRRYECTTGTPIGDPQPATGALHYDPSTDRYIYTWNTEKTWTGTCCHLILTLVDGTTQTLDFQFR